MNRLAAMISIIKASIKRGAIYCEVPTNKLSLSVLNIFREQGYIYGYSMSTSRKRQNHTLQYPRYKVFFKYADTQTPILKDLKTFKMTRSNFYTINSSKLDKLFSEHKLYIISNSKGLSLTNYNYLKTAKAIEGKLLVELTI